MKKTKILIVLIIILLLFALLEIYVQLQNNYNKKTNEDIREIRFEPYSNEDNLNILVTFEDSEYKINKITYTNQNGEEQMIKTSKNKVSIDYEIKEDGKINFTAENENGETFEKELIVDENYRKLIDIQVESKGNYSLATEIGVTLNYSNDILNIDNINKKYKIGKSNKWIDYTEPFNVNSYQILDQSLQEDNKTVIIYAKSEDNANNRVIISKKVIELDLDMPQKPTITYVSNDEYATLKEDKAIINSEVEIDYGDRDDIQKLYSIDNGKNWLEYTGKFKNTSVNILAKSVKNISGLYNKNKICISPSADNSLKGEAFDEDENTSFSVQKSNFTKYRVNIDPILIGEYILVKAITPKETWSSTISTSFYNEQDEIIYTKDIPKETLDNYFEVPEGTSYYCIYNNDNYTRYNIYEIIPVITKIIHVSNSGDDSTGDGSEQKPYASVSNAISNASNFDKIYIEAGNYELTTMSYNNTADIGIYDEGKTLEIYGENDKTILNFNGNNTNKRDGAAITLTNSNSIIRNLTYVYEPKNKASNYSKAIFRSTKGTISNVFFRIIGEDNASYLYQSATPININNCTFFHNLSTVSDNYNGYAKWTDIATNVKVSGGTTTNTQIQNFGNRTDSLENLISQSRDNETFNNNQAGVYYGAYAWEK